jgi:NADH:ubiquinone oxidoreductase subunit 2 (subunit N)
LPVTVFAFGLAGMSLMGLPPSGGFVAKLMLLTASVTEEQWWWAVVILLGGLLAAGYVFRVLAPALAATKALTLQARVSRRREGVVLALAVCALLLGLLPLRPSQLLQIGRSAAWVQAVSVPAAAAVPGVSVPAASVPAASVIVR